MAVFIALTLLAGMYGTRSNAATLPEDAHTELAYVGTQERQIHALRFDTSTGKLTVIGPVVEGPKSTWIAAHPRLPILYSVDDDNTREGSVTAYAVDRGTGALTRLNEVATRGSGTTNLGLDTPSMTLLAANYGGGSVSSIAVNRDGSLGSLVSTIKETGSGPNRRQASAHAHSAIVDPSGRYALVPDLGADRVFVYGFDRATHSLSPDDGTDPRSFIVPPGSGPRHLAFGSNGQYVYLLTELTAEIMVLRWDASQGRLTLVQSVPTSSQNFQGVKGGAEVAVSHDGRFVYVEDRGENALVVYRISSDSGELSLVQRTSSGGERPWGFAIDPSGKWMLVANQRSGKVNVFSIDPTSGMVSDTGQSVGVPTPVSIAFVK
ncbi:lactonase family protein [Paraburkholderia metrosideri]|uniref:Lactonase family protein n=1 Tax=Paraburkholderia metrosideri TaxID=580937 RepID=A0ABW9DP85_9BURK